MRGGGDLAELADVEAAGPAPLLRGLRVAHGSRGESEGVRE